MGIVDQMGYVATMQTGHLLKTAQTAWDPAVNWGGKAPLTLWT